MIDDMRLLALIPKGERNAISSGELEVLTGGTKDMVCRAVRRLRQSGRLICAVPYKGGYYQPETREELASWVRSRELCIKSYKASVKPAKDTLKGGINTF